MLHWQLPRTMDSGTVDGWACSPVNTRCGNPQPSVAGLTAVEASKYVLLYWGGLMIGCFMGAVELSESHTRFPFSARRSPNFRYD